MLAKASITSKEQAHVIRLRATGGEGSVCGRWESGFRTKPSDHRLLDDGGDGSLIEGIHRLIEGADDYFGCEGGEKRRTVQMRGRAGMADRNGICHDGAKDFCNFR